MLFWKFGGEMALLFPSDWREWRFIPCSREIGETFTVFIWGQWRAIVNGPERARKVIEQGELRQGWAWSPPITLLGKSCFPFLDDEDAECLRQIISGPLSHQSIVKQAPAFAELAEKCIDDILAGHFNKGEKDQNDNSVIGGEDPDRASDSDGGAKNDKIKFDALRSYTFDLIDGPILNLNMYSKPSSLSSIHIAIPDEETGKTVRFDDESSTHGDDNKNVPRENMILWMERLKYGLGSIKLTFGPRWMHFWRLNWYGRALDARTHLDEIIGAHVEEREKLAPVHHEVGFSIRDPLSSPIPLIAITRGFFRSSETVTGRSRNSRTNFSNRARTQSEPDLFANEDMDEPDEFGCGPPSPPRGRAHTEPDVVVTAPRPLEKSPRKKMQSVLDQWLRQEDFAEGRGITRAATTEISLLLWMMMDAGQAWTAMALSLLSTEMESCELIQAELDQLETTYGTDRFFTPFVLGKMEKLDALIYESIRLCPQFLGGMKVTNQTVEVDDVQIPKNTSVIFCQPTEEKFDMSNSLHRRPEDIGLNYPSVELYGFLPFEGLEVPVMVLQTKVFLAVLLQKHSPWEPVSKRRTFIRKVHDALINKSFVRPQKDNTTPSTVTQENSATGYLPRSASADSLDTTDLESGTWARNEDRKRRKKQKLPEPRFTLFPFPEPRRVIQIRPREMK
jgi:hypothetical protein